MVYTPAWRQACHHLQLECSAGKDQYECTAATTSICTEGAKRPTLNDFLYRLLHGELVLLKATADMNTSTTSVSLRRSSPCSVWSEKPAMTDDAPCHVTRAPKCIARSAKHACMHAVNSTVHSSVQKRYYEASAATATDTRYLKEKLRAAHDIAVFRSDSEHYSALIVL